MNCFNTHPFRLSNFCSWALFQKRIGTIASSTTYISYPENQSINSFRDLLTCTVHCTSIDDAASIIAALGPGAMVAKYVIDIKSTFRLIPIAPSDFDLHVLSFKIQEKYYFDKMLPFWASISCAIWEHFATSLCWITQPKSRNLSILQYLDDFLFSFVRPIHYRLTNPNLTRLPSTNWKFANASGKAGPSIQT